MWVQHKQYVGFTQNNIRGPHGSHQIKGSTWSHNSWGCFNFLKSTLYTYPQNHNPRYYMLTAAIHRSQYMLDDPSICPCPRIHKEAPHGTNEQLILNYAIVLSFFFFSLLFFFLWCHHCLSFETAVCARSLKKKWVPLALQRRKQEAGSDSDRTEQRTKNETKQSFCLKNEEIIDF